MRLLKVFLFVLAGSAAVPIAAADPTQPEDAASPSDGTTEVRVMSFNIRYNNPGDGQNAWPHRRDHVARIIRANDVDVAGLQEALADQVKDLQVRLPDYRWHGVGRDDGKEQGEFGPIFYRNDRWEVVQQGEFWLSEQPDQPGRCDWGAACPRMATWLHLRSKKSDRELTVVNTHLDHVSAEARRNGASLLLNRMSQHPNRAVVLTGDLNCLDSSPPYQILTGTLAEKERGDGEARVALRDAFRAASRGHDGPDSTWNGFREIVPGRRIDFVFVGGPVSVRAHRILDDRAEGRFPSDHLPVLAELVLD